MAKIEIKKGLGTIMRTHTPIVQWYIVVGGRRVATLDSKESAIKYVAERYGSTNPTIKEW